MGVSWIRVITARSEAGNKRMHQQTKTVFTTFTHTVVCGCNSCNAPPFLKNRLFS